MQIPGSPSPSSMGQRYTDRWERMPAIECSWAVARGSVGHVPVPASGALAPIGVALAMATWEGRCNSPLVRSAGSVEACETRETGQCRAGAEPQRGHERSRCATNGIRRALSVLAAPTARTKRTTPPTEHDRNWNRLGLGFSCAPRRIEFQIRFVDERKVVD